MLDLFSGAGGSSLGALRAGAELVAGIDMWEDAVSTYEANFPQAVALKGDIRRLSPKSLHRRIGHIDLMVASPECTSHSCAKGANAGCEDSRMTAFQVTRFAREFRPEWIVVENVTQMEAWPRFNELLGQLARLGYEVKLHRLSAEKFGVPQSRKRLFLLCSLSRELGELRVKNGRHRTASSVIDTSDRYALSPLFSRRRAKPTLERAERAIEALGARAPFLIVYYGSDGGGGWQPLDKPLRTVTTLDRFAYVVPTKMGYMMRMLQPDELKLAMGFPRSYKLEANARRGKIKLLGNAVCPPVMAEIVRSIVGSVV